MIRSIYTYVCVHFITGIKDPIFHHVINLCGVFAGISSQAFLKAEGVNAIFTEHKTDVLNHGKVFNMTSNN